MGDMSHSEKKKLKNLRKFRDGHRKFVQKTIEDAKGLITQGNPIEVKRLKFLRTALETTEVFGASIARPRNCGSGG